MKWMLKAIAGLALLATLVAPVLRFSGAISDPTLKTCLLAAAVLWFAAATPLSSPAQNNDSQD